MKYTKVSDRMISEMMNVGIENYGAILLAAKICALSKDGHCTASNAYFAEWLHCGVRNVQKYLERLKVADLIKIHEVKTDKNTTIQRIMYPQPKLTEWFYDKKTNK